MYHLQMILMGYVFKIHKNSLLLSHRQSEDNCSLLKKFRKKCSATKIMWKPHYHVFTKYTYDNRVDIKIYTEFLSVRFYSVLIIIVQCVAAFVGAKKSLLWISSEGRREVRKKNCCIERGEWRKWILNNGKTMTKSLYQPYGHQPVRDGDEIKKKDVRGYGGRQVDASSLSICDRNEKFQCLTFLVVIIRGFLSNISLKYGWW